MCQELDAQEIPLQQIVVCGQDKKLYNSLSSVVKNARHPIVRLGYVNNVQELMSAARLIVTKAGGLTVSEALTKRLPLVIFRPIPGQEEENAKFLRKSGAGKITYNVEELRDTVISLLQHPEEAESMAQSAAAVFPGKSADRAVEHIFGLLDEANNRSRIG